ncbi:MAG TPA: flagellar hook-associated protein FlgK [Gammaproteobacteria bacterium]|nr:flagellar hook-associated protein FlgK [Gammaproteobacteria bacterium]
MVALFETGVSALLASQRALATTGHNISNVNTPGFARQRVNLATREAQLDEGGFRGKGVQVASVDRLVDRFVTENLRTATTNAAQAGELSRNLRELNNLLGDSASGVSSALGSLFASFGDLAADPSSQAVRGVVIDNLQGVVHRFNGLGSRLGELEQSMNAGIVTAVSEINDIGSALATLNSEILQQAARSNAGAPNDLLDRRDELLRELAQFTRVDVLADARGAVDVSIGNGLSLVSGPRAIALETIPDLFDLNRVEIAYASNGAHAPISELLQGGRLAAMFEFQRESLIPARRDLGRIAVALQEALNTQHRSGMDFNGNLGRDLLTVPPPTVQGATGNAGTVSLAFVAGGAPALTADEYGLEYDGANLTLRNLVRGTSTVLGPASAGPFTFDGVTLTVGIPPAAGDRWRLSPTLGAAEGLTSVGLRPSELAMALPVITTQGSSNVGDARISGGEVLDPSAPSLLATVNIVFDSPTSYQVNGVGPSLAFASGANIDLNGWRVQVTGTPRIGDTFTVSQNMGGASDARNAVNMIELERRRILDNGTSTFSEAYAGTVSRNGSRQRQGEIAQRALETVLERSVARQQEVSGVNLDEEAANLMRFQQAYQAAAQVIRAADTAFQALINATRG